MREKQKIKVPDFTSEKKLSIQAYFALLTRETKHAWLDGAGYSMLPLFWPGCKVRVNTDFETVEIGQVVMFAQGKKMVAHRIVKKDENGLLLTKGDTLYGFDRPVDHEEIVGIVDCVKRFRKSKSIGSDPALAALSLTLGNVITEKMSAAPVIIKKIYYFFRFIPGYLFIMLRRIVALDQARQGA